jgi:hypothetical protein
MALNIVAAVVSLAVLRPMRRRNGARLTAPEARDETQLDRVAAGRGSGLVFYTICPTLRARHQTAQVARSFHMVKNLQRPCSSTWPCQSQNPRPRSRLG